MYVLPFRDTRIRHTPQVGGENISLSEMLKALPRFGVYVSNRLQVTDDAYRAFFASSNLEVPIRKVLAKFARGDGPDSSVDVCRARYLIHGGAGPERMRAETLAAHQSLSEEAGLPRCLPDSAFVGYRTRCVLALPHLWSAVSCG